MNKVKEINVWFEDDSHLNLTGEDARNATVEFFKYSRDGHPRVIELGKNNYYAAAKISSFHIVEEEPTC